jgi:hypothetical protein
MAICSSITGRHPEGDHRRGRPVRPEQQAGEAAVALAQPGQGRRAHCAPCAIGSQLQLAPGGHLSQPFDLDAFDLGRCVA